MSARVAEQSRSGVTGRRADLKSRCPSGRAGSTPASGTIFNPWTKPIRSVYGPYLRKYRSGRSRYQIVVVFEDGAKTSMSHARWVMTQHLGRRLEEHEHVDHINEDPQDDRIENLQLLTPRDNSRKSLLGRPSPLKGTERGWKHGTMYGWMKKRCLCSECQEAKINYYAQRNARRRKPGGYGARR